MSFKPHSSSSASARSLRLSTLRSAAAASNAASSSAANSSSFQLPSSFLSSQPVDHLLLINQFLEAEETIILFRCNRRLYNIPLNYRVELNELLLGSDDHENGRLVESGRQLANFRFCLSSLCVDEIGQSGQRWKAVWVAMQLNPRMFISLKHFSLSLAYRSRARFDPSCLPLGLESLTIDYGSLPVLTAIALNLPRFSHLKSLSFSCIGDLGSIPPMVSPTLETLTLICDELDSRSQAPSASVFPASLRTLNLSLLNCDGPLLPFTYLIGLEVLQLPRSFNQPLTPDFLPASVKSLNLGRVFSQRIQPGLLPLGLEILKFADYADDDLDEMTFNRPLVPGSLPPKLKILYLSDHYNHSLPPGVLPDSLIELHFPHNSRFNQPFLPGSLPSSLVKLRFGMYSVFNQPFLPGALPSGLQTLVLDGSFDQPLLPGSLPPSLKSLSLGISFNQPIEPGSLPASLKSIRFGPRFNQPLPPGVLSSGLQNLSFGKHFNQPLLSGSIPSEVRTLQFGREFNQPLPPGALPSSLTELCFTSNSLFNQPLSPGSLPSALQRIEFGECFNQPLPPGVLPASLTELKFGNDFNHPFQSGSLPPYLRTLHLGYKYSRRLFPNILPGSLRELRLCDAAFFPLPLDRLPPALVLSWTASVFISFKKREKWRSRYSIGRIVQLSAAISAALGLDTDLRFRVIDAGIKDCGTKQIVDAALIEQIEPSPMPSDGSDSAASASRYWVSGRHLLLRVRPAKSSNESTEVPRRKKKRKRT
jgi:hypothetical protein